MKTLRFPSSLARKRERKEAVSYKHLFNKHPYVTEEKTKKLYILINENDFNH